MDLEELYRSAKEEADTTGQDAYIWIGEQWDSWMIDTDIEANGVGNTPNFFVEPIRRFQHVN